jgi:two-component system response regulator DesR
MTALRETGVLVAEDNDDLRGAMCALIEAEPDMHVTAAVDCVAGLLAAARTAPPQVLVLDLDLAGQSSVGALRELSRAEPRLGVVVYSGHDRASFGMAAQEIPRCEFVTKSGDATELLDAIRRAAEAGDGH